MKALNLTLLVLSFYSSIVGATDNAEIYQNYVKHSRELTRQLCSTEWASVWGDQIWAGIRHSFTADDFMTLPPELSGLMEGDGYEQGLRDCFGENRTLKDRFTVALLVSSSVGRFAGTYGTYRTFTGATGRMVSAPVWIRDTKWALTRPSLARATGQFLAQGGNALGFFGNAVALTGLGINIAALICQKFDSCYMWLRRQELPSQTEMTRSGLTHDPFIAQMALQIAVEKLNSEKAEFAQLPRGHEADQTRIDLELRITQRTAKIGLLAQKLGLPNPLSSPELSGDFTDALFIAP